MPLCFCASITAVAFFERMHHRLFAVNVLARMQRIDRDALVPVVGRGDDYGVHIGARQNFAVVAGGEQIRAPIARGRE